MITRRPLLTLVQGIATASLLGGAGLIGYSGFAAASAPTVVRAATACCEHHEGEHHEGDHHEGGHHDHHEGDHHNDHNSDEGGDSGSSDSSGGGTKAPASPKAGMTTTTTTTTAKAMVTTAAMSGSNADLPFGGGLILSVAGLGLLRTTRRLRARES
jgi:hypothetical protein